MINYNGIDTNIDEILEDQGYSIFSMEARVKDKISDSDGLFNIYCALEGDVADKRADKIVDKSIKEFISEFVIGNLSKNSEYDYMDIIDEIIEENISEFNSLNDELSCYGDKQLKIWEDDEKDLDSYYYSTRL